MEKLNTEQIDAVVELALSFYPNGRIDWDDLIDRAERNGIADFGDTMLDPEITRVKRHVRKAINETRT